MNEVISQILNAVFGPLISFNPALAIFVISTMITTLMSVINKNAMKGTKAPELKVKMEEVKKQLSKAQKEEDKEKINKYMKKMMEINSEYLHAMMKPMMISLVISMLFVILFFPWLSSKFGSNPIMTLPDFIPLIGGGGVTWIWFYIICSILVGLLIKRILGI